MIGGRSRRLCGGVARKALLQHLGGATAVPITAGPDRLHAQLPMAPCIRTPDTRCAGKPFEEGGS